MLDEIMPFLVKEEPDHYSFDAFVKDGGTEWSGVKNPLAQKHLRSMRKGDVAVVPSWVPHGAWTTDTHCLEIDVFSPPREDFVTGGTPAYMRAS